MNLNDLDQLDYYALSVMDNGIPNQMLKNELRKLSMDLLDRKGDATAREVHIKLSLKPVLDPAGNICHVNAELDTKAKIPPYRTETYQLVATEKEGLFINTESPKQVDQRTFGFTKEQDGSESRDLR